MEAFTHAYLEGDTINRTGDENKTYGTSWISEKTLPWAQLLPKRREGAF